MTSLKSNNIIKGLQKKGFQIIKSDHVHLIFCHNGKRTAIWTKVSHGGNKEIGDILINKMSQQLRLNNKQEFKNLVDCIISREDYLKILENQNIEF